MKSKKIKKTTAIAPVKAGPGKEDKDSLFSRGELFFSRWGWVFYILSFILMFVFSLLLFDMRISEGGDDSSLIVRAYHFAKDGSFPGFQAPLYPIVLSLFVKALGLKIVLLKFFSLCCILTFGFFFYKSFKNRVPSLLAVSVSLVVSVNSFVLYFASQTYSEAFFMMVQSILFLVMFRYFIDRETEGVNLRKDYGRFLLLGFCLFLVYLSRNIGLVSAVAVAAYFVFRKQWKSFLFSSTSFLLMIFLFEILKKAIWSTEGTQLGAQTSLFLQKDFYNASLGQEDFAGFITRFTQNSKLYFAQHFWNFVGFASNRPYVAPAVITYFLFVFSFLFTFRKNNFLFFSGLYVFIMSGTTFFVLQSVWGQYRMILVYFPYMLLFFAGGLYYVLKKERVRKMQFAFLLVICVLFISTLSVTVTKVSGRTDILRENLKGDILYGMAPGWKNFLHMSKWAAENVPETENIASRKADMSFIYTGREFYPVYNVPTLFPDSFLKKMRADTFRVAIGIPETEIFNVRGREKTESGLRPYLEAVISARPEPGKDRDAMVNGLIYMIPVEKADSIAQKLTDDKVIFSVDIVDLMKQFGASKSLLYEPDVLLKTLKKNNVWYFIVPNVYAYNSKDERVALQFSTMQTYMHMIQVKYPVVTPVHTIGEAPDESHLVEIRYDLQK